MNATPHVTRRGEMLILTLPDAINPVIWQMDVAHVRTAALGVVAHADRWQIRCRGEDGTTQDVALYETRDQAMYILGLVHTVLTDGTSTRGANTETPKPRHLALVALSFGLFVALVMFMSHLIAPLGSSTPTVPESAPVITSPSIEQPALPQGEPMNADDILQNRGGTP